MRSRLAPGLIRRLLVAWTLCLLLAGCTPQPELEPLAADAVVLAFGDSLTFGTGAAPDESYPEVLSGLIGRTVVKAGVPGEVSADGLLRLPAVLDREQPALLLLCHGGNDQLQRLDPARLADTVASNTILTQNDPTVVSMTVAFAAVLGQLVQGHPLDSRLSGRLMQLVHDGVLPFHAVTSDNLQPPRPGEPEPPRAGRFASPDALLTPSYMAASSCSP